MTQHLLQAFEAEQIRQLSEGKTLDSFDAGDNVRVHVKIVEGANERIQVYEGVVIGKRNRGLHSSFTVRKISHGTGIERTFMLYSPRVARIERIRRGHVRRAKLYYLRDRSGKATRIREKRDVISTEA